MNLFPKRQESNEAANPRLHQAFMSPLMIALPASNTHTQDMFDQLQTAAELELIEIIVFIQDKPTLANPGVTQTDFWKTRPVFLEI